MTEDIKKRDLGMFALLMFVTLGFYSFYLIPKLGLGVNHLIGRKKFDFTIVLLISIFTLGIGMTVFEVFYAYNLERNAGYTKNRWNTQNLGGYVLILNIIAWVLIFASGGLAFVLSFVAGCWATWLIQNELNRYIDLNTDSAMLVETVDSTAESVV